MPDIVHILKLLYLLILIIGQIFLIQVIHNNGFSQIPQINTTQLFLSVRNILYPHVFLEIIITDNSLRAEIWFYAVAIRTAFEGSESRFYVDAVAMWFL